MYLLGVDAGGSRTTAVLADLNGRPLRTTETVGANPYSCGVDQAFRTLEVAVEQLIDPADFAQVSACVIGLAGYSHADFRERFPFFITRFGWRDRCVVVPDLEVAFAAGTSAASGTLLLAGTGATAAKIVDHCVVRQVDGSGWLLGDEGAGFWLGREAVAAVLRALDGRAETTSMAEPVADALGVSLKRSSLISAIYLEKPVRLARLAPIVTTAAAKGDGAALAIVHEAAARLTNSVAALSPFDADNRELVLAGGVLRTDNPLSQLVSTQLQDRFGMLVKLAENGAIGAVTFAARLANRGQTQALSC